MEPLDKRERLCGGYNRVTYDVEDVEEDQAASYGRKTAQPDCHSTVSGL